MLSAHTVKWVLRQKLPLVTQPCLLHMERAIGAQGGVGEFI